MQVDEIAKQRFESFKLGLPSPTASVAKHRHARSHSRNASISSTASLTTTHDMPPAQPLPAMKRNSHHRRISSVSTRRESAEMMGVTVSDPSVAPADDPGEERRHALWALEGKRDASYSKVEIPELPTPFDFPTKPSFPPGSGAFMNSAKRDSFKPSISKDFLGTLVEEEEEEEEEGKPRAPPPTPMTPTMPPVRNSSVRPRPAHLSLRPLSLTPDNLSSLNPSPSLPTPPSPRRSSLKLLALAPEATSPSATAITHKAVAPSPTPLRARPVLNLRLSAESMSSGSSEEFGARPQPTKRSSISYKTSTASSITGLPTPETTPTCTERRFSGYTQHSISSRGSLSSNSSNNNRFSVTEDDFASSAANRPLSASEQHFLFRSHNALLARITDLERALSFRNNGSHSRERTSRPSSVTSVVSNNSRSSSGSDDAPSEPLDEMLSLVADLKAERDELKRDVEGWRVRVADMEKQLAVFGNRVEVERREAWVARTRVGLLEVERDGLEKRVGDLEAENERLVKGEEDLKQQVARLLSEKEKMAAELQEARGRMRDADPLSTPRAFDGPVVTMKPIAPAMKRGLGFTSLDSESSATDVEDGGLPPFGMGFKLRVVEEEEDEEDNGLANYEDEDEGDDQGSLSPSSSFGSVEEFGQPTAPVYSTPTPQPETAVSAPTHVNRASISKTWTFPRGAQVTSVQRDVQEVDRFFGCLEDLDDPPSPSSPKYSEYDEERSKGLFAKGFSYDGNANSCFVLPAGVLATVDGSCEVLDVVQEEDEVQDDEEEGETEVETVVEDGEVNNGIKITFTPPAEDSVQLLSPLLSPPSSIKKPVSPLTFFEDDDEEEEEAATAPFNFGRPRSAPTEVTTPPSVNARPVTPSSIPRPAANKPASFTLASAPRASSPTDHTFVTPPNKRSYIPQPTSPTRTKSNSSFSVNASAKPSTTFIRQPAHQPLMPNRNGAVTQNTNADAALYSPPRRADNATAHQGSAMNSVDLSDSNIPQTASTSPLVLASSSFSSLMSSPLAGRLSFQTLTNYIPSWGMTPPRPQSDAAGQDSRAVVSPTGSVKRGYVSKQSQLERLKSRLERETVEVRSGRQSDGDAVFL